MSDSLDTVMTEWKAFDDRHPEYAHLGLGGLTMGLMKALYECPDCPGSFRVPIAHETRELIGCAKCGGMWEWREPEPEKPTSPGKRSRKAQS